MIDPSIRSDMSNHSDGGKDNEEVDGTDRTVVVPFRNFPQATLSSSFLVDEETSQVKADSTATNANAAATRMPTRILIVDDSSMNRFVLCKH